MVRFEIAEVGDKIYFCLSDLEHCLREERRGER